MLPLSRVFFYFLLETSALRTASLLLNWMVTTMTAKQYLKLLLLIVFTTVVTSPSNALADERVKDAVDKELAKKVEMLESRVTRLEKIIEEATTNSSDSSNRGDSVKKRGMFLRIFGDPAKNELEEEELWDFADD